MLVLTGAPGNVTELAFSSDGKLLAVGGGQRGLEMWEVHTGRKWGRYTGQIHFLDAPTAFHPTEPLCFACANNALAVIDTRSETVQLFPAPTYHEWLELLAMTPDCGSCIGHARTGRGYEMRRYRWRTKKPLDPMWGAPLEQLSSRSRESLDTAAIRTSPDGKTFATLTGVRDRRTWTIQPLRVSLRSVKTGEVLRLAKLQAGTIPVLAFAPDARTFVTCRSHIINIWSTETLSTPREVRSDTRRHFTGAAFHPSGKYLAATSNDTTVKLYDTTAWKVAHAFTWDIGRVRSVTFSPDGTLAAAGSDTGKVVVWDVDI
ncbi:WD40 repeat domain-containing protein [Gemmata sp. G18]|uniref:WD40 repeat domain-containing protein n=1 Tax=Gemmata palustris TaxID=2822762 RepID=A0ABS5BZ59_9BACT|nr:WD40 repeat domain-containing protein [Gemmata palustris]MBP3958935.1 WD40 repeat domain-containing protein [Gemmata palustris]